MEDVSGSIGQDSGAVVREWWRVGKGRKDVVCLRRWMFTPLCGKMDGHLSETLPIASRTASIGDQVIYGIYTLVQSYNRTSP